MDLIEAIYARRSVRRYQARPVEQPVLEELLRAAAQAPSAMNSQPWAFGIITGADRLRTLSDRAKAYLLERIEQFPMLERYRNMLANPATNLFYGAPALVMLYAKPAGPQPQMDCCLAAQTLMLAAHGAGLGSCWIGLAAFLCSSPEMMREFAVPDGYTLVAPIIIGYPDGAVPVPPKDSPEVLFWEHAE